MRYYSFNGKINETRKHASNIIINEILYSFNGKINKTRTYMGYIIINGILWENTPLLWGSYEMH